MNLTLGLFAVFLAGVWMGIMVNERILKPWARRRLGRPLECDLWGLPKDKRSDPPMVREYFCDYPKCGKPTGSDWDKRCIEHTIYMDGGRP